MDVLTELQKGQSPASEGKTALKLWNVTRQPSQSGIVQFREFNETAEQKDSTLICTGLFSI